MEWKELLETLVNTPTGPDLNLKEKKGNMRFLIPIFEKMGFNFEEGDGAFIFKKGEVPYILLLGHLDTVFKKEECEKRPFKIKDGKAYGPGVADMKGGVVVMIKALEELLNMDGLMVILNFDEEIGSTESRKTFERVKKEVKYTLSFEPSEKKDAVIGKRKGIASIEVDVLGEKGHAARLHEGANSIVALSYAISQIWGLNAIYNTLTLNPTIIKGGIKSNVTPDHAYVYFDVRYYENEEITKLTEYIKSLEKSHLFPNIKFKIKVSISRPPMHECTILKEEILKLGYDTYLAHGGADPAFFDCSIDGLGLPGKYFHSEKEFVWIDEFEKKKKLAVELIKNLKKRI